MQNTTQNETMTPSVEVGTVKKFWWQSLAFAFGLHLIWEFAQTPFFEESSIPILRVGWARFHCALADTAIQTLSFVMIALIVRHPLGPLRKRWLTRAAFITLGVLFTAGGEIYHVGWLSTWSYSRLMPRVPVLGIGWVPLLQWIAVPGIWIYWISRRTPPMGQWPGHWPRQYVMIALLLILMIVLWPDLIPMYGPTPVTG